MLCHDTTAFGLDKSNFEAGLRPLLVVATLACPVMLGRVRRSFRVSWLLHDREIMRNWGKPKPQ